MPLDTETRNQMVAEAIMILNSINFVGLEFEKLNAELDKMGEGVLPFCEKTLFDLQAKALALSKKLDEEDRNIEKYYKKYQKYEKETILPNFAEIKQTLNRGVSPNKDGQTKRGRVQKNSRKKS